MFFKFLLLISLVLSLSPLWANEKPEIYVHAYDLPEDFNPSQHRNGSYWYFSQLHEQAQDAHVSNPYVIIRAQSHDPMTFAVQNESLFLKVADIKDMNPSQLEKYITAQIGQGALKKHFPESHIKGLAARLREINTNAYHHNKPDAYRGAVSSFLSSTDRSDIDNKKPLTPSRHYAGGPRRTLLEPKTKGIKRFKVPKNKLAWAAVGAAAVTGAFVYSQQTQKTEPEESPLSVDVAQ